MQLTKVEEEAEVLQTHTHRHFFRTFWGPSWDQQWPVDVLCFVVVCMWTMFHRSFLLTMSTFSSEMPILKFLWLRHCFAALQLCWHSNLRYYCPQSACWAERVTHMILPFINGEMALESSECVYECILVRLSLRWQTKTHEQVKFKKVWWIFKTVLYLYMLNKLFCGFTWRSVRFQVLLRNTLTTIKCIFS